MEQEREHRFTGHDSFRDGLAHAAGSVAGCPLCEGRSPYPDPEVWRRVGRRAKKLSTELSTDGG
jgi:hypothetical protein